MKYHENVKLISSTMSTGYKKIKQEISAKLKGKYNGDLFVEVRQRVAAFQYYQKFWNDTYYRQLDESHYLDEAYRFLYQSVDADFILFCAIEEGIEPIKYCDMLLGN